MNDQQKTEEVSSSDGNLINRVTTFLKAKSKGDDLESPKEVQETTIPTYVRDENSGEVIQTDLPPRVSTADESAEPSETTESMENVGVRNEKKVGVKSELTALFEGKEIIYRLNPECPGLFVMINNVTFDDTNYLSKRDGAEKDKECLKNLFECMNYEFYVPKVPKTSGEQKAMDDKFQLPATTDDLTFKEMDDVLDDVAKKENYQSLVVVISSHGNDGVVFGKDHKKDSALELKVSKIVKKFMNESWAGKPKVLIFQACQGDVVDLGYQIKEKTNQAGKKDQKDNIPGKTTVPEQSDLLVVFSSDSPHPSWRNPEGTYVLQEFAKAIKKYGDNLDLIHILLVVIHEVANRMMRNKEGCYSKQNPCFKSYMRKLFYFPSQSLNATIPNVEEQQDSSPTTKTIGGKLKKLGSFIKKN